MPAGNHVPTSQDCRVCHVTTGFLPGTFDHAGPETVGKQCMDCHDNVIAKGKTPTHEVTNQDCSACHDTAHHFLNATSIDHSTIASGCADSSCHGFANTSGTTTTASYKNHIPIISGSELDCVGCHTTNFGVTFSGATMNHSVVPVSTFACSSCHNNVNATGQATAHYTAAVNVVSGSKTTTTTLTCDACHNTTDVNWTPKFTHATSYYPGDHSTRKVSSCNQCHNDKTEQGNISSFESSTYAPSKYNPDCAACHESNFTKASHHKGDNLANFTDCYGSCHQHKVSSSSF